MCQGQTCEYTKRLFLKVLIWTMKNKTRRRNTIFIVAKKDTSAKYFIVFYSPFILNI